jgi:hypothetical protein
MALTLKDLLVGALGSMATRGGVSGSVGRIGLAGMAASHAIPGKTGITGQIGEFARELGKLPEALATFNAALVTSTKTTGLGDFGTEIRKLPPALRDFNEAIIKATTSLGGIQGSKTPAGKSSGAEAVLEKLSGLKEFAEKSAATEASSGGAEATEITAGEAAGIAAEGAVGGAVAGPEGAAVGAALAIVAVEVAKFVINLRSTNAAMLEQQRSIGQYNGQITAAFAQLDIARIQRRIETARDTEDSTRELAKQQNRLEENLRPLDATVVNFKNSLAAAAAQAESVIIEGIFGKQPKREAQVSPLATMAKEIADGKLGGRHYPPIGREPLRHSNK